MNEDDPDVFTPNLLDKYFNRPDHPDFDQMCYADFAATFISTKAPVKLKCDDVRSYIRPAGATNHDYESDDDDDDDDDAT